MIRKFRQTDIENVMQIWLDANLDAHDFIEPDYWRAKYEDVKHMIPQADVYVYENEEGRLLGFTGLTESYIAGIFVSSDARSNGIGSRLLHHLKLLKSRMTLHVYARNERAVTFYQRERFVVKDSQTDQDTGEAELLMLWEREDEMHDLRPDAGGNGYKGTAYV